MGWRALRAGHLNTPAASGEVFNQRDLESF